MMCKLGVSGWEAGIPAIIFHCCLLFVGFCQVLRIQPLV
jgi:hypothetical protein